MGGFVRLDIRVGFGESFLIWGVRVDIGLVLVVLGEFWRWEVEVGVV